MNFLIATRGSKLALWQAERAHSLLCAADPALVIEIVTIRSSAEERPNEALHRIGRTGVFTAEIDDAVIDGRAHIGVHSLKDMSTDVPAGLVLAATLARGPVEDVLVSRKHQKLVDLPAGARVATGSVRRVAMLKRARPDLEVLGIRGNVDTRLAKLLDGQADALVMARAGLERLGLVTNISEVLDLARFLPAAGQGTVGITCKSNDARTLELLRAITDPAAWAEAGAERALLAELHAGCNAPLGALARARGNALELSARVLSRDGTECLDDRIEGELARAAELGRRLATRLIDRGAKRLIDAARGV